MTGSKKCFAGKRFHGRRGISAPSGRSLFEGIVQILNGINGRIERHFEIMELERERNEKREQERAKRRDEA